MDGGGARVVLRVACVPRVHVTILHPPLEEGGTVAASTSPGLTQRHLTSVVRHTLVQCHDIIPVHDASAGLVTEHHTAAHELNSLQLLCF